MNARMAIATSAVALLLVSNPDRAEEAPNPLVGTWVLCVDPDGSPKDAMEFFPEGYGFNLRPDKPKVPFLFREAAGQVMLAVNARGNLVTVYLKVDQGHTRLTNKSERTGNEAFYVRKGKEAESNCTAK